MAAAWLSSGMLTLSSARVFMIDCVAVSLMASLSERYSALIDRGHDEEMIEYMKMSASDQVAYLKEMRQSTTRMNDDRRSSEGLYYG